MKFLKRINLFVLISFFLSSASVTPVLAMQTGTANTMGASLESVGTFIKNIFTLEYLNGENGEHRNSPFLEKVTSSPDRALTTVATYALALFVAKKAYDFADKSGMFDPVVLPDPQGRRRPVHVGEEDRGYAPIREPRIARPLVRVAPDRYDNDDDSDDSDDNGYPAQRPQRKPSIAKPINPKKPNSKKPSKPSRNKPTKKSKNKKRPSNRPVNNPVERPVARPVNDPMDDYRDRQRERYQQQPRAEQENNRPVADRHNNARIANPLPGQQLHLNGMPHLPGFYHMQSHTPYHAVRDACGVNAAYNMAQVEARVFGRQMNDQEFRQVQEAAFPELGRRGASNVQVARMTRNLGLGHMGLLLDPRRNRGGAGAINARAAEFHRANGPRAVHFLCEVPGHWISISVVRHADGSQAMYLYDNLNNHARSIQEMRHHVESVYNRFF